MYSKGLMWLSDTRIPFVDDGDIPNDMDKTHLEEDRIFIERKGYKPFLYQQNQQGRFTPNLLVCDNMLNDGSVSKSVKGGKGKPLTNHNGITNKMMRPDTIQERNGFDDKGTNSRYYDLDLWFDKMVEKL